MFYGTSNDVYVVKKSVIGSSYAAYATLTGFANYVCDIKLTRDKTYVAIGSMSKFNVYYYNSTNDSFTVIQEESFGARFWHLKI